MDSQFLKELYFHELNRRAELDEVPTRLATVLTLIVAVFAFYVQNFSFDSSLLTWVFGGMLVAGASLFLLSITWIARASIGYQYAFLAYVEDYENFAVNLREYYANGGVAEGEAERLAAEDVSSSLRERLVAATTRNARNNNRRAEIFYTGKRLLLGLLCAAGLAGVPVLVQQWAAL